MMYIYRSNLGKYTISDILWLVPRTDMNGYENGVLSIWYNDIIYFFSILRLVFNPGYPYKEPFVDRFWLGEVTFSPIRNASLFSLRNSGGTKGCDGQCRLGCRRSKREMTVGNLWYLPMGNVDLRLGNLWESMENVEGNNLYVQIPCKRVLIEPPFSESCWTQNPAILAMVVATQFVFNVHPENWGRWTHFDFCVFFRWVGEKPPPTPSFAYLSKSP